MHIEHKQFLDLVAEASGMDLEKAEKQLAELIKEVKQSLSEGEAYEIEGFGIFSSLGNRVMFIPSDELETEINFKYVGMEPIELDEPTPELEDPFEGLDEVESSSDSTDSRFAGLIDDEDLANLSKIEESEEPAPGPDKWGVTAHKEDESADRLFASLMGEEYEQPIEETEGIDTSDTSSEDDFSDVFADADDSESGEVLADEVASFMTEETELEEASTDDLLDDIFAEDDTVDKDFGEDLILDEDQDEGLELEETQEAAPILELDTSTEPAIEIDLPDEDVFEEDLIDDENPIEGFESNEEIAIPEMSNSDDFDDPFYAIEEDQFDESVLRMEDLDETEIIPVIKNITTDVPESEPEVEKEKSKKELQKEEKERKKQEQKEAKERIKQEKNQKKQEAKEAKEKAKAGKTSQPAPAWLWIVLVLVVVGGGVFGLGYFSIINIPFITPQSTTTVITPPQTQQQTAQVQQSEVVPNAEVTTPEATPTEGETITEQPTEAEVQQPIAVVNETSPSADQYGLTGQLSTAGNDGYTIILYTLSNQSNAVNEAQKLIDAGYRGFLTPVASERFGTLYRVSLGQFSSLFDAAVAAEEVESLLPENYIIKKIN